METSNVLKTAFGLFQRRSLITGTRNVGYEGRGNYNNLANKVSKNIMENLSYFSCVSSGRLLYTRGIFK